MILLFLIILKLFEISLEVEFMLKFEIEFIIEFELVELLELESIIEEFLLIIEEFLIELLKEEE